MKSKKSNRESFVAVAGNIEPAYNKDQKYGYLAGGASAWAVLLAKTSRRTVPTAVMPIIAGGRLYKCLYKMHVDSRAFWGAFRVFLIDVG